MTKTWMNCKSNQEQYGNRIMLDWSNTTATDLNYRNTDWSLTITNLLSIGDYHQWLLMRIVE